MSNDLGNAMKHYKRIIARMKHVAKLLREPEEKRRNGICLEFVSQHVRARGVQSASNMSADGLLRIAGPQSRILPSRHGRWRRACGGGGIEPGSTGRQHKDKDKDMDGDSDDDSSKRKLNLDFVDSAVQHVSFWVG